MMEVHLGCVWEWGCIQGVSQVCPGCVQSVSKVRPECIQGAEFVDAPSALTNTSILSMLGVQGDEYCVRGHGMV
jgi:hypothetical protein